MEQINMNFFICKLVFMMNLQFVAPIFFLVILKFRRGRFLYTPSYFYYLLIIIILFFEENIFVRLKIFNSIRKDKKKIKRIKRQP